MCKETPNIAELRNIYLFQSKPKQSLNCACDKIISAYSPFRLLNLLVYINLISIFSVFKLFAIGKPIK